MSLPADGRNERALVLKRLRFGEIGVDQNNRKIATGLFDNCRKVWIEALAKVFTPASALAFSDVAWNAVRPEDHVNVERISVHVPITYALKVPQAAPAV